MFTTARSADWTEFLADCAKFEQEIAKEIRIAKFTLAELEEEEQYGRSRGGFTSRLHLSADGRSRPLSLIITPRQRAGLRPVQAPADSPSPNGTSCDRARKQISPSPHGRPCPPRRTP